MLSLGAAGLRYDECSCPGNARGEHAVGRGLQEAMSPGRAPRRRAREGLY